MNPLLLFNFLFSFATELSLRHLKLLKNVPSFIIKSIEIKINTRINKSALVFFIGYIRIYRC